MGVIYNDNPGVEHQVRDLSDCFVIDNTSSGSLFFKGVESIATYMGVSTIMAWTYVSRGRWKKHIVRRATMPEIRAVYPDYRVVKKASLIGSVLTTPMPVVVEWEVKTASNRRAHVFIHYFPSMRMACASLGIENKVLRALHAGQVPPWRMMKNLTIQSPGYSPPRGCGWHLGYAPGAGFLEFVSRRNKTIDISYAGPSNAVFDEIPIHALKLG